MPASLRGYRGQLRPATQLPRPQTCRGRTNTARALTASAALSGLQPVVGG